MPPGANYLDGSNGGSGGSRRSRYSKATTPLPLLPPLSIMAGHRGDMSGNMRTPVAWHLRDVNLSRPGSAVPFPAAYTTMPVQHRYPPNVQMGGGHNGHSGGHPGPDPRQRPSSPSATTTSSDDREEVPMVRAPRRPNSHMRGHSADRRSMHSVMSRASRLTSQHPVHHHQVVPPHMAPYDLITYGPPAHHPHHHQQHHQPLPTGTLRSSRSVPALALAAGYESAGGGPCPLHGHGLPPSSQHHPQQVPFQTSFHHQPQQSVYAAQEAVVPLRRFGSMIDIRSMPGAHPMQQQPQSAFNQYTMVNYLPEKKFMQYSNHPGVMTLPRQAVFQRPHMAQFADLSGRVEPFKMAKMQKMQQMQQMQQQQQMQQMQQLQQQQQQQQRNAVHGGLYEETVCCKGHLVVLWIILGVVTIGVISGIVLGVTMN